jgi:hypothetical protein
MPRTCTMRVAQAGDAMEKQILGKEVEGAGQSGDYPARR